MNIDDNCVDPEVGRLVFRWAVLHGPKQGTPQDPALIEHLKRCAACRGSVRQWTRESEAAELMSKARRIISGNLAPGEQVDEKLKENGEKLFFKSSVENPSTGLLIRVAPDGNITEVGVADRASFDLL
ncbi:MAG TPA: hypothetical protein VHW72_16420 [Candidatus Angelobacter sp.]|jgi:predicted anti-sigma-YlaC factor YlaD|nr:hypothetical protein [Candidatus Angelobacter sp.]